MRNRRFAVLAITTLLAMVIPGSALASPPSIGEVLEGAGVPGGSIGDSRAQIEASLGTPSFCQSITSGDLAACTYNSAEGSLTVRYVGADGGDAQASPTDVVHGFNWSGYQNWTTTSGVGTASTADEVVAAYPDAEHTVGSFGFESVVSLQLGVSWTKTVNPYFRTVHISMSVFPPIDGDPAPDPDPDPDPDPGQTVSVEDIVLQLRRNTVTAIVAVVDDGGDAVSGAEVTATWTLPDGTSSVATATTNRRGDAKLSVAAGTGMFTITIDSVDLDGHTFVGGVLTASIGT